MGAQPERERALGVSSLRAFGVLVCVVCLERECSASAGRVELGAGAGNRGRVERACTVREGCQRHGRVESGSGSGSCVRALIYKRGGTNVNVEYLQV